MTPLQDYEKSCDRLMNAFIKSLYPNKEERPDDLYWVGGEIGGVLSFGDWFVDPNKMAGYFRYNFTSDEFFDWYDDYIAETGLNMKHMKHWKSNNK